MELFTKKNIFIGLAIIATVSLVLGVGIKAYNDMELQAYREAKRPAIELGKDYETLTKNVHTILKEKDKDKAYALFCMDGANTRENRIWKKEIFDNTWEKIEEQDYSESTIKFEYYEGKQSPEILIDNIKDKNGNTLSKQLSVANTQTLGESYECVTFY